MRQTVCGCGWLVALCALLLPLAAHAQKSPLGSEFQVNTYTTSAQTFASLAASAEGDFVVVWQSFTQDGSGYGIFGQRFSSAGVPLASEFQVNAYTPGWQTRPAVAAEADGDFVVVWGDRYQETGDYGVFGRRFSSAGAPLGVEFQVNTYTPGFQFLPAVALDAEGDFVVAWESDSAGSARDTFARVFSSAGVPLTGEVQVNTFTTDDQRHASVAAAADGDFVVAWQSPQDGSSLGVFARSFSSAGVPLTAEFQVNTYTTSHQNNPAVAADAEGAFVVAWQSFYQDGYQYGLRARRFSSAGTPLGGELQVSLWTLRSAAQASVDIASDGDFVIAWNNAALDREVFARRFASTGAPLTAQFQVNTYTTNYQVLASVASDADGNFVVAWQSLTQEGLPYGGYGIFAQRFAALATLDVDGNGQTQALTDGLLVLRRFFGLSGVALTGGVVGGGCTRCDAAAIEPYVAGLGLTLDIDGNGATQALTDGLLVVRYLFGLRDGALTGSAVGAGCTRCDADAIQPYIAALIV